MELIAAAYTATSYLNEHEEQATDYEREDIFLKKFLLYFALLDV